VFIWALLLVTALSGYATWPYYKMKPRAVPSGTIAIIAAVLWDWFYIYIAVRDPFWTQEAYRLSHIERGIRVDWCTIEQIVTAENLLILLGISMILKVISMALVLASRKHLSTAFATPQANEHI
jgi:hypothetical protein